MSASFSQESPMYFIDHWGRFRIIMFSAFILPSTIALIDKL